MKKILLMATMLLTFGFIQAQSRIYRGWSTSSSDCEYTMDGNRVYRGWSTSSSDCAYTIDGNRVYRGWSTSSSDCVATIPEFLKSSILACIIGRD